MFATKITGSYKLKNTFLIPYKFHIMFSIPSHVPIPLYLPSALATFLAKENTEYKWKKSHHRRFSMSWCVMKYTLCPYIVFYSRDSLLDAILGRCPGSVPGMWISSLSIDHSEWGVSSEEAKVLGPLSPRVRSRTRTCVASMLPCWAAAGRRDLWCARNLHHYFRVLMDRHSLPIYAMRPIIVGSITGLEG